jgi:GDP-L-fucose synthase
MYVDDLAEAVTFLMENIEAPDLYEKQISFLNVGTGEDITIRDAAVLISEIIGYKGKIVFDPSHPDGTPRKLLDVSRINQLGWKFKTPLREGVEKTYKWFLSQIKNYH